MTRLLKPLPDPAEPDTLPPAPHLFNLDAVPDTAPLDTVGPLFEPGNTCWRVERADRAAVLIDAADYFSAAKAALLGARHQIILLGWDFDPRTRLEPQNGLHDDHDRLGQILQTLTDARPELTVHVLKWNMYLPVALRFPMVPLRLQNLFTNPRMHYHLDDRHPLGATQHQKLLVVDDRVALCGGIDFAVDRWDTPTHRPHDARRRLPGGGTFGPRHDVGIVLEGPIARTLGELARDRWANATGRPLAPPPTETAPTDRTPPHPPSPWPGHVAPDFHGVEVAVARTHPAWGNQDEVREVEALYMASIARAKRWIYLESQYFASRRIADLLANRLDEPDGPDVVLMCSLHSPSYFDRLGIDPLRSELLARLRAADRHGRFRALAPVASDGGFVVVHSKVTIIDGVFLRIGSSNLAERSMGFDSELDVAIQAEHPDDPAACTIRNVCCRLWADHMGVTPETVRRALDAEPRLSRVFDRLRHPRGKGVIDLDDGPPGIMPQLVRAAGLIDPATARPARRVTWALKWGTVAAAAGAAWWAGKRLGTRRSRR